MDPWSNPAQRFSILSNPVFLNLKNHEDFYLGGLQSWSLPSTRFQIPLLRQDKFLIDLLLEGFKILWNCIQFAFLNGICFSQPLGLIHIFDSCHFCLRYLGHHPQVFRWVNLHDGMAGCPSKSTMINSSFAQWDWNKAQVKALLFGTGVWSSIKITSDQKGHIVLKNIHATMHMTPQSLATTKPNNFSKTTTYNHTIGT